MFGRRDTRCDVRAYATLQPEDTCTVWMSLNIPADLADGWTCGRPAVRAVRMGCPCGHALTGLECEEHAANTDRLSRGQEAAPNACAECNRQGHFCPVATSGA